MSKREAEPPHLPGPGESQGASQFRRQPEPSIVGLPASAEAWSLREGEMTPTGVRNLACVLYITITGISEGILSELRSEYLLNEYAPGGKRRPFHDEDLTADSYVQWFGQRFGIDGKVLTGWIHTVSVDIAKSCLSSLATPEHEWMANEQTPGLVDYAGRIRSIRRVAENGLKASIDDHQVVVEYGREWHHIPRFPYDMSMSQEMLDTNLRGI